MLLVTDLRKVSSLDFERFYAREFEKCFVHLIFFLQRNCKSQVGGWEIARKLVEYQLDSQTSRIAIINCGKENKLNDAIQSGSKTLADIYELLLGNGLH